MTEPLQTWAVSPHSKPTPIGGNMLTVTGDIHMPLMELPRRMTVVRLHDARLVVGCCAWRVLRVTSPTSPRW